MGHINSSKPNILKIKALNLFLIALILVAGAYYLVGINNLVVKGFKLQELKKQEQVLATENQEVTARKVALESYQNIEGRLADLRMVAIDKMEYLTVNEDVIAKR